MASGQSEKWQVAFWIMAVFMIGAFSWGATSIIANDRIRSSEDSIIKENMTKMYTDIVQRLARIETKIEKIQ